MDLRNVRQSRSKSRSKQRLPPIPAGKDLKSEFEKYLDDRRKDGNKLSDILGGFTNVASPPPELPKSKLSGGIDQSLTTSLLKRVSYLEKTVDSYRTELKERMNTNYELQQKIIFYEDSLGEDNKLEIHKIYEENQKLKDKITYIQHFLEGYGIRWKDLEIEGELNIQQLEQDMDQGNEQARFRNKTNLPKEVDIHVLEMRVKELNSLVLKELGINEVVVGKDGMRGFAERKPKHIVFFSDGVFLEGFPFFKYETRKAVEIIGDIYDGFFPKQLEKSFPDGVLLRIIDKLDERHSDKNHQQDKIGSLDNRNIGKPLSKDEFLKNIPQTLITPEGRVHRIREEVGLFLSPSQEPAVKFNLSHLPPSPFVPSSSTSYLLCAPELLSVVNKSGGSLPDSLSLIKLRLPDIPSTTIYYCGTREEKVDEFWSKLQKELNQSFHLFFNFPRKEIEQSKWTGKTLEEAGLFPRAAVNVEVGQE